MCVCVPISTDEAQTSLVDKEGSNVTSASLNGITVVRTHVSHTTVRWPWPQSTPSTSRLLGSVHALSLSHNAILEANSCLFGTTPSLAALNVTKLILVLTAFMPLCMDWPQHPEEQPLPAALEEDWVEDGQLLESSIFHFCWRIVHVRKNLKFHLPLKCMHPWTLYAHPLEILLEVWYVFMHNYACYTNLWLHKCHKLGKGRGLCSLTLHHHYKSHSDAYLTF